MAALTSLAAQLQRLATPQTSILDLKRDRRSILFEPSEAARYGRDVYFDIGRSGYEALVKTDPRFTPFAETLFGRAGKDLQRAVETQETNTRLDGDIEKFLLLLSPYLQKEAAFRALEWLVYRFQVNEMNVQPLLMCIFPYYESALFTRVVQIVALGGDRGEWQWLSQCQKSARPLPKLTVFTQWAKNQSFRNFLADYLRRMMKVHTCQNTPVVAASFYITTVLGGLGATEVKEEHIASIVKSLPQCLASQQTPLLSGSYLLLAHLSTRTRLSPPLLTSLLHLLIESHPPTEDLTQQCLLLLLTLAHHQQLQEIQPSTAAALGAHTALLGSLETVAREKSVAALLSPYVVGYVRYLMEEKEKEEEEDRNAGRKEGRKAGRKEARKRRSQKLSVKFTKLVDYIASLPLSSSDAAKVIWSLMEAIHTHLPAFLSLPGLHLGRVIADLELAHPQGHGQATQRLAALQRHPTQGQQYKKVLQILLLPRSASQAPCFTQLLHPDDATRTAAVKSYLARLARGAEPPGESTSLHIRSMLSDDAPEIVRQALSTPQALEAVPLAPLAKQCCELASRAGKGWRKVRQVAVAALTGTLMESCDDETLTLALGTCLPLTLLPRAPSDLVLAKVILRSKLATKSAFLSALRSEVAAYLSGTEVKVKDYCAKVWSAVPRVIKGLSASEQATLWDLLEGDRARGHTSEGRVVSLALLHAGLGTRGVKGHLALRMAHRMMDLCLDVLEVSSPLSEGDKWKGDSQVTPDDLHVFLGQVRHGRLPLDLLLGCVLRAGGVFSLPPACLTTPYWTPSLETEVKEGHLLLLVKVTRAALRLETAGATTARDAVLLKVFKECLPDPKAHFHFLALPWGWQSSLPHNNVMDETLQTWTLTLGQSLLAPHTQSLAWSLATDSPLVPALISALSSTQEAVRRAAIGCLRGLKALRGAALGADTFAGVVKVVVARAEEVVADGSQLASVLGGAGSQVVRQVAQCLLGVVVQGATPPHIRAALLYALSAATQPAILLNLLPLAEKLLLDAQSKHKSPQEEEEECLDQSSSLCLLYILQRFTPEAGEVLETEGGWGVFERSLGCSKGCLRVHGEAMSPQSILLMEVLSPQFLTSLKSEVTQAKLWALLVTRVTNSDDPQEASRLRHALRRVTLDAQVIAGQIEALELTPKVTSIREARVKRMKMKETGSEHLQAWSKLRLMLETLSVMGDLTRPWLLVTPLSQCLQLTLTLDLTFSTLLQQQLLSSLLHLLQKAIEELGEEEVSRRAQVSVEVIVQVIRASLSHDTQRRALLLLTLAARLTPESVLHNMMAIFTFMGTSLLRRDDAYSFQVIHQTIQAIVPTLVKCQGSEAAVQLAQVCQVFVDALPDLPHHRRLPLFTTLATTTHPDTHLWLLLALLADSHVMRGSEKGEGGVEEEEKRALPHTIQFSLSLAAQFAAPTQVRACVGLVRLVSSLPDDRDGSKIQQQQQLRLKQKLAHQEEDKKRKRKTGSGEEEEVVEVFLPLSTHTQRQIFHLKYTATALIGHLLTSEKFVAKAYEVEEGGVVGEGEALHSLYGQLLEVTMGFLDLVTSACDLHRDKPSGRLFTSLQRKVVEVVEGVTNVLPPTPLLQVTQGLLNSPVSLVRCRGAELLAAKLVHPSQAYFSAQDTPALNASLDALCKVTHNKKETAENLQTYLFCLQLLTRYLAGRVPRPAPCTLQMPLDTALEVVCAEGGDVRVVTQALLVAAEGVAALGVGAVGCLGRLMPALTQMLATATTTTATATTTTATATTTTTATQLLAILTTLHKVVDSLPQLVSPYLEGVVCQLCVVAPPGEAGGGRGTAKLAALLETLVKKVEPRILVPRLTKAFHTLAGAKAGAGGVTGGQLGPLHSLVTLVGALVGEIAPHNLPHHRPPLLALLMSALDLRHTKGEVEGLEEVEVATFSALSRLLLRLPEHDNIAIFTSLLSWASPDSPNRLIAFYRFSQHLASTYKVLFLAAHLAEVLLPHTAELLAHITSHPRVFGKGVEAEKRTCALLEAILDTLTKICTHDSIGFVTADRFHLLCAPLTGLLGVEVGGREAYDTRVRLHLSPCLTQLAMAVGDDAPWRHLAGLVLPYLRDDGRPQVVLGALEVLGGLVDALGEDFLRPLLADIIPPVTEAVESSNKEVEAATRQLFARMEEILGDALRTYLDY